MYSINRFRSRIAERRLRFLLLLLPACVVIALSACQSEPAAVETVEVTREVPVSVSVEVTRVVPQEVEVTREVPVEVTRVVPQQVEVTREVPVEVTRVVPQQVEVTREVPVEVIKEVEVEVIREVPVEVESVVEILMEKEIEVVPEGLTAEMTRFVQNTIDFMKEERVNCWRLSEWAWVISSVSPVPLGPIGIPACYEDGSYR